MAYPGFHFPSTDDPAQEYAGAWKFSPEYGADVGASGDTAELTFWGTDVGLSVRRAGYQARFYVTVDGEPANALPRDESGAALVLSAPDYDEDYVGLVPVASGLEPGPHTLALVADGGTEQWPLRGFAVAYQPPSQGYRLQQLGLGLLALAAIALALHQGRQAGGEQLAGCSPPGAGLCRAAQRRSWPSCCRCWSHRRGWLTWGGEAAGLYRRLGDGTQLALTAAAASLFYVTPWFFVYVAALALLFVLLVARPAWGLALVAFTIPFWVKPKAMLGYRFSPVEVFLLLGLAAWAARWLVDYARATAPRARGSPCLAGRPSARRSSPPTPPSPSLSPSRRSRCSSPRGSTWRLNEWRTVIVEPALFYLLLRAARLRDGEMWTVLDAFVLGAVAASLYGLVTYAGCMANFTNPWCHSEQTPIIMAGDVPRLRGHYGSPNNLALYLERVLPLLLAAALTLRRAAAGSRRWSAGGPSLTRRGLPIGLALLLTLSKGSLFLGVPASLLVLLLWWVRATGRRLWPWLLAVGIAAAAFAAAVFFFPPLQRPPQRAGCDERRAARPLARQPADVRRPPPLRRRARQFPLRVPRALHLRRRLARAPPQPPAQFRPRLRHAAGLRRAGCRRLALVGAGQASSGRSPSVWRQPGARGGRLRPAASSPCWPTGWSTTASSWSI
jgi:hypothetical protein